MTVTSTYKFLSKSSLHGVAGLKKRVENNYKTYVVVSVFHSKDVADQKEKEMSWHRLVYRVSVK